jgi:hypothetical protein
MSNNDPTSWVVSKSETDFGVCTDADDYFHPKSINPPGASVTETYYFGFSVPEEKIFAFLYLWLHPNLNVLSGGVVLYQGRKRHFLAADYHNWMDYLDTSHINADNGTVSLPNGFVMKVNKPFKEHEMMFEDKQADTRFHVIQHAAMPAAVRGGNKHFEQNMKVEGELVLRGKRYRVDCYSIRDRSWAEHRPEDSIPVPPYTWITIGDKDFAMNVAGFDDMGQYPQHPGITVPPKLFADGWVYRDGVLTRILSCTRKTVRDDDLVPLEHTIEATDKLDRHYSGKGITVGGSPIGGWKNIFMQQTLMRWEVNGVQHWGESQDVHWHEFERFRR